MGCVWGQKRQATWRQGGRPRPAIPYNAPVRRRLIMLVLFLLAGAAVNIAVAWGFALQDPQYPVYSHWTEDTEQWIAALPLPEELKLQEYGEDALCPSSAGLGLERLLLWAYTEDEYLSYGTQAVRAGWPLRSLAGEVWSHYPGPGFGTPDAEVISIRVNAFKVTVGPKNSDYSGGFGNKPRSHESTIPYRPIWPGFAINTVFYAVILWLLIRGPFVLRRHVRQWRGRCVKCGYDLRDNLDAGCPECGWNREEVKA